MRALTMDELSFVSGGFDEDGWGSGPSHWLLPDPLKELEWDIMFGPFSGASDMQKMLASEGAGFGGSRGGGAAKLAQCTAQGLWSLNTLIAMGSSAFGAFTAYMKFIDKTVPLQLKGYAIAGALAAGAAIGLGKEAMSSVIDCMTPPLPTSPRIA